MATHTVRILSRATRRAILKETESRNPLIVPAYVFVKPNDDIEFISVGSDATISFPDEQGPFLENIPIRLTAGQKQRALLGKTLQSGRIYPYSVFVKEDSDFAEGNSSPKIIIE